MRTRTKNRLRTQLRVESLEVKILLSTGSLMRQVAPLMRVAPIVAQAAGFSGTLAGSYSKVNAPGFANVLSYDTSGSLTGAGSTHLRGTLFGRVRARTGGLIGQFKMHNNGSSMVLNVFRPTMRRTFPYKVVRARGSDTAFLGGRGTVMITQSQTINVPFYTSGQATMTFTPS
jgi:hypothetical protein